MRKRDVDQAEIEKIMTNRGWLAEQPPAFQKAILNRAVPMAFKADDYVFHSGDDLGGIYGVLTGGIGLYAPGRDLSLSLMHVLRAGYWFGQGPAMTRRNRTRTFRVLEPTRALLLPLSALNEIAATSAEFARHVGAISEFSSKVAGAVISDLLIRRSDRRIAATLLRATAADEGVQPSHPDGFHLTQADLAEMSNVSRDVMNRTLAQFKSRGWIATHYNRIAILDVAALSNFAAGMSKGGDRPAILGSSASKGRVR